MILQMGSESPLRATQTYTMTGEEEKDKEMHPCNRNLSWTPNPRWHSGSRWRSHLDEAAFYPFSIFFWYRNLTAKLDWLIWARFANLASSHMSNGPLFGIPVPIDFSSLAFDVGAQIPVTSPHPGGPPTTGVTSVMMLWSRSSSMLLRWWWYGIPLIIVLDKVRKTNGVLMMILCGSWSIGWLVNCFAAIHKLWYMSLANSQWDPFF